MSVYVHWECAQIWLTENLSEPVFTKILLCRLVFVLKFYVMKPKAQKPTITSLDLLHFGNKLPTAPKPFLFIFQPKVSSDVFQQSFICYYNNKHIVI